MASRVAVKKREKAEGGSPWLLRLVALRFGVALCALALAQPVVAQQAAPPAAVPSLLSGSTTGADGARNMPAVKGEGTVTIASGYARIVLLLDEYVPSTVRLSAGVLVLNFKRPVNIPVERLAADLADYVSVVRRDPDGMGLRMALTRRVTVNTMEAGERLFIDLLPDSWKGPPPGLPQYIVDDLARRARDAEKKAKQLDVQKVVQQLPPITVRVGNHPTFTRFVFGLPEQGPVMVDRAADRLTLRFDKPYPIDLAPVRGALPWYIGGIDATQTADEMLLRMVVAPQVDVRAFREEGTYVLDLSTKDPRAPEPPKGNAPDAGKPPPRSPQETVFPGENDRVPPVKVEPPAPRAADPKPAEPKAPEPKQPEKKAEAAEPQKLAGPSAEEPAARPKTAETPPPVIAANTPVQLQVTRQGDTYRIIAPFSADTPSAIFQRGDTLWMVFGPSAPVDLSGLQGENSGAFRSVDATRSQNGTAIRVGLDRVRSASASREGSAWIVTLADKLLEPPKPVNLARATGPQEKQLASADFEDAGGVHRVSDPLAGDELIVVTGRGTPRSFVRPQDYVEFSALQGAHGLVFQPLADDVSVEIAGNRVLVTRPNGLLLSSGVAQSSGAGRIARRSVAAIFDPQVWRFDREAPFNERQSELMSVAAAAHDTQRTARRLDLARFYMAQELWVEAKSVIDAILKTDKRTADDGSLQILKALINTKIGRLDDAIEDLGHVSVANTQDGQLWRSVVQSKRGQDAAAMEGFKSTDTIIASLPDSLRRDVLLQAAETALNLHDLPETARRLAEVEDMGPATGMESRLALLQGKLLLAKGHPDEARIAFSAAVNSTPNVAQADGELQLLLLDDREGKLKPEEALEAFERLSYGWRGDRVEAQVLGELGQRLAKVGRYRDAFNVLKSALLAHPMSEHTRSLQDVMMAQFEDIFLGRKAQTMKPVEALALFYDFKEMVPQGRKGDEIMRQLADRHVELDMLDSAAALLQYQISERYKDAPVARAQIAARLAMLHLMNRKPEQAVSVLRSTRMAELPETLREQRYLLEAQALGQTNRYDQALDLIGDLKSKEAQLMRFDLLWGAQKWQDVGEAIEQYLTRTAGKAPALTDQDRQLVLRSSIAYALAGDQFGLDRVASKFGDLMKGSADERSFQTITAPVEARGLEFREIAKSLAGLDTFEAFMENYKARYPDDMPGNTQEIAPANEPAAKPEAGKPAATPGSEPPKADAGKPAAAATPPKPPTPPATTGTTAPDKPVPPKA